MKLSNKVNILFKVFFITAAFFVAPGIVTADTSVTFSSFHVSNITQTTATANWTTNIDTDSRVWYSYLGHLPGQYADQDNGGLTHTHTVTLTNLIPASNYVVYATTTYGGRTFTLDPYVTFTTLPILRRIATPTPSPAIIAGILNTLSVNTPGTENLTSTSVKIFWETNHPSDSYILLSPGSDQPIGQNESVTNHIVPLSNLTPGTTYSYRVKSKDASGNVQTSPVNTFTTLSQLIGALNSRTDTTPPVITNIRVSPSPIYDIATITWNTDEDAKSQVFYSTIATATTGVWDYEYHKDIDDGQVDRTRTHSVTLRGLAPGTTYSFRVVSGNISQLYGVSSRNTFTTVGNVAPSQRNPVPLPANVPLQTVDPLLEGSLNPSEEQINQELLSEPETTTATPVDSSKQAAFENTKKSLLEELKQEQQATKTPTLKSALIVASLSLQTIPWQLYIVLVILVIGFITWLKFRGKKLPSKAVLAHEIAESPKKPWSSIKTAIVVGVIISCLILFGSLAPFLPQLLYYLPIYLSNTQNDKAMQEAFKAKLDSAQQFSAPVTQITYSDVPDSVKQITIDCNKLEVVPKQFRGLRYYCQNIYLTDPEQIKAQTSTLKSERILLYGQYSYYDCPVTSPIISDMIGGCFSAAKFLDNWQFPQMIHILGVKPTTKVSYHFTQTLKETQEICQSLGTKNADACTGPDGQIYLPTGSAQSKQFSSAGEVKLATLVESLEDNKKPIVYNFTVTYPQNCFLADTHEILHFFDYQQYGTVSPSWFEEGLVRLLIRPIYNQTCPPGLTFSNVSKREGNTATPLTDFDLDSLDLEEPLSAGLMTLAQGDQCRKGIYMQLAKNIKDGGVFYIKRLYSALQKTPPTSEATAAKAVWESGNKDTEAKQFLIKNGCSF